MSDISLNRCYVYSVIPSNCRVCCKPLIKKEYYIPSKTGRLISYQAKYCPYCRVFAIKYGTYTGQKKNWIVLNGQELQRVAQEYNNRTKKYNIPSLRKKAVVTIRLAIFTMMNLG